MLINKEWRVRKGTVLTADIQALHDGLHSTYVQGCQPQREMYDLKRISMFPLGGNLEVRGYTFVPTTS